MIAKSLVHRISMNNFLVKKKKKLKVKPDIITTYSNIVYIYNNILIKKKISVKYKLVFLNKQIFKHSLKLDNINIF